LTCGDACLKTEMIKVGAYVQKFNDISGADLPGINILKSSGLYKHVLKNHAEYIGYIELIPEIIEHPDYIGINPSVPDSIELMKLYDEHILISIELDRHKDYLYVSSLYKIMAVCQMLWFHPKNELVMRWRLC
jgi:hypothetical protein